MPGLLDASDWCPRCPVAMLCLVDGSEKFARRVNRCPRCGMLYVSTVTQTAEFMGTVWVSKIVRRRATVPCLERREGAVKNAVPCDECQVGLEDERWKRTLGTLSATATRSAP